MSRRPDGDRGTITVLAVGFTAILLLLVALVVDVSAVVLARRSAASAADGAAIAAAQQLDQRALYDHGLIDAIPLSGEDVVRVVAEHELAAALRQPGLVLEAAVDASGTTTTVTARRSVALPFVGWLGISAVTVTAVARARAPLLAPDIGTP